MHIAMTGKAKHPRTAGVGLLGRAFTLVELLVVIAIIGILSAGSLPAIRALTQSNTLAAGNRQMLDELAFARQSAIAGRRTVFLVFVPPTVLSQVARVESAPTTLLSADEKRMQVRAVYPPVGRRPAGARYPALPYRMEDAPRRDVHRDQQV